MFETFDNFSEWRIDQRQGWANREVPGNPKVTSVIASYRRPRQLLSCVSCLMAQTYKNYELIVVHDGPDETGVIRELVAGLRRIDDRVHYYEMDENKADWGNSSKEYGSKLATGDFIHHSNDDNYYAPVFYEAMLHALQTTQTGIAYCNMIHSHFAYAPFDTQPRRAYIDGGGWIAKADLVKNTPWPEDRKQSEADGIFFEGMTRKAAQVKVPGFLFTHN